MPDPAHLRAQADQLDAEALEALDAGDLYLATSLRIASKALRDVARLTRSNRPVMVHPVTDAQAARRGASVALTAAKKTKGDVRKVRMAIAGSQWKSLTRYSKERLGRTQAALSRYLSDSKDETLETPPDVADRVKEDFGLGDEVWPRPPRRERE